MSTIQVQPMQWAGLPLMGSPGLAPFSPENDAECFRDIRDVLARHNALQRFGVFLIHKHFEVADDEELMESTDQAGRMLTIAPVRRGAIDPGDTVATNWVFTEAQEAATVLCKCATSSQGHGGYHRAA